MKTVRLGDVAEIVSGATPKSGVADFWDGDIAWVTPADLSKLEGPYISATPRTLTEEGVRSCSTNVLPVGSVLLSSRAPIGHVAINTVPMATNQGFKSLVPRPGLEAKFLYHWLNSKTEYLQSLGNGATFKELSKRTATQIEIPHPPIEEQRRIAAILDQADALRTKRRQSLAHLDDLTQSIFHAMFGATADTVPLGDLCRFYSGGTPSKKKPELWAGELPWFSAKDLKANELWDSQDHIAASVPEVTSLRLLPAETIAVVVRGMILAHSVPISVIRVPATINQDLKAVLPRDDIQVDFLASALRARTQWILARTATAAHGTKRLETAVLESIPIPEVSRSAQAEFARRVSQIRAERSAVERVLAAEDELFASLQSRAFSGGL
ncbi:restriction endonuclease subunit S [Pseudactinotalea sp. Z1732]|uniref:restriction endonuclease subunit S n=1 Tax=Micrococcales TaxID=85006 RepID=UPI003C7B4FFF